jgi:PRC-barrel domain
MKKSIIFASAAMIGVVLVLRPTGAQVASQTVELAKVNVQRLAAGYRASKVIGSSVVNDANETIGKIDDILVSSDGRGAICRAVDRRLSRHGQSLGCSPLRQPEICRQKVRATGRHKRRPQNAA